MATVRTIRDGLITIEDGTTPTAESVPATFDGELSWRVTKNFHVIRDRGTISHVRQGMDEAVEVSFNILVDSITDGASATVYDALTKTGGASSWAAVQPTWGHHNFKVTVTLTDPGTGTDDETIVFAACQLTSIEFSEGEDGNRLSFTLLDCEAAPTIS